MVAFSTMPTDRSTSLAQNTKVMAKVRMPRILICLRITDMLPPVIKAGTNTAKPTITAISASNTPLSLKLSSFFSRCSREGLASCAASAGADCSCAAVRSTLSPAMYLSIVPLVVPAGTVLMCFPLRNRSISSLRAVSSSISDEVSTTAKPCRVMRSMSWYISCLAPTSMPRVGSSSISSLGLVASHLASSTFCWLPPDSSITVFSGEVQTTFSCWMYSSAMRRLSLWRISPFREVIRRTLWAMLCAMDHSVIRPVSLRSEGTMAMFFFMASNGETGEMTSPSRVMVPPSKPCRPNSTFSIVS